MNERSKSLPIGWSDESMHTLYKYMYSNMIIITSILVDFVVVGFLLKQDQLSIILCFCSFSAFGINAYLWNRAIKKRDSKTDKQPFRQAVD